MSQVPTVRGPVEVADLGPHIHDEVLPYVREHGVTEEQIATMLTGNPRRLFEGTG